ncbi:DUF7503 family protein [Halocatena marina]|uniref:Uncharacterized protein n=1 Tax=Halocatena marina TaxID=2934937 RepID=A0ABD5YQ35_9EURY|nr:hypothetical protein [Halocatena marina]
MEESTTLTQYLAEHPRMIGVAAVMCFLLTQVGNAAAAGGGTIG